MLIERSYLIVRQGMEEEFANAMRDRALPILDAIPGVLAMSMGRGVENPDKFALLVEWESMDAHTAFRSHPNYGPFREILAPYVTSGAMEHFEMDRGL